MATPKSIADDPHKAVNLALGKRLAQLRTLRNLSQRELAERVNVVQVVVSNYEIGKLRITSRLLYSNLPDPFSLSCLIPQWFPHSNLKLLYSTPSGVTCPLTSGAEHRVFSFSRHGSRW